MTFNSLAQRIAYSYTATFPDFVPVQSESVSEESQRQMHSFLKSFSRTLYDHPELLGQPMIPDDAYEDGAMQNSKPDLIDAMRRLMKKSEELYLLLMKLGETGNAEGGKLQINKSDYAVSSKTLAKLKQFGLDSESRKDIVLLWSDIYPALVPAWKLLSGAALGSGSSALLVFSRCLFDPKYPHADSIFLSLATDKDAHRLLEAFFKDNGYNRMENRDNTVCLDWYKTYAKKDEPLKTSWAERIHGGISIYFDWKRKNPLIYGLRVPRFRELLAHFDEMDESLKAFVIAKTKKCDGCGYCTQTDKTGARPRQIVSVEHDGQYDLCTLFPGFSFVWTAMDGKTAADIIAFLSFTDKLLGDRL